LLASALILVHALALWAVWASLRGWPAHLAGAAIVASLTITLGQALLWSGQQTVSLELREDGHAAWRVGKGTWQEGTLGRRHFVSEVLVVLELERPGRAPKRVVLLPDSAAKDDLRRLRVWLRWQGGPRRPDAK
jgi:hypothetical protein